MRYPVSPSRRAASSGDANHEHRLGHPASIGTSRTVGTCGWFGGWHDGCRTAAVRTPAGIVTLAVGLALLLRAPYVGDLAFPDEAGLLIVAQHWHGGGANLYGTLFVDRPPLLLLFYELADGLGGIEAARLMGLVAAAVVVAAAGWIGHTIAGRRGTAWAALAAAALVANPMIGTTAINAELLGAPLTLLSVGCLLAGVRPPVRRPLGWRRTSQVALAGALGAAAVLVKQNLFDALVFGAALALTAALAGRWPWVAFAHGAGRRRRRRAAAHRCHGALGGDRGSRRREAVGDALRLPRRRVAGDRQRRVARQRRPATHARVAVGRLRHRGRRRGRQREPLAAAARP